MTGSNSSIQHLSLLWYQRKKGRQVSITQSQGMPKVRPRQLSQELFSFSSLLHCHSPSRPCQCSPAGGLRQRENEQTCIAWQRRDDRPINPSRSPFGPPLWSTSDYPLQLRAGWCSSTHHTRIAWVYEMSLRAWPNFVFRVNTVVKFYYIIMYCLEQGWASQHQVSPNPTRSISVPCNRQGITVM